MLKLIFIGICALFGGFLKGKERAIIMLSSSFLTFCFSLYLLFGFLNGKVYDGFSINIAFVSLNFGFDLLNLIFISLVSGLWFIALIFSLSYIKFNYPKKDDRIFQFCYCLAVLFAILFALARDVFTMFIIYEFLTISTIPLIAFKKNSEVKSGLFKYLIVLFGCSFAFLLPATLFILSKGGGILFDGSGFIASLNLAEKEIKWLFVIFLFGIGKSAFFPFHVWLPSAMVAPTPVSGLLHAVAVVKVGAFFVLRLVNDIFGLDLLAEIFKEHNLLAYISGFTVFYASLIAVFQSNLKKRLAFSTISQISYIALSLSTFTKLGIFVAMFQIVSHALSKILLFFTVGAFYTASHSNKITDFTGMAQKNKISCFAFLFATLSLCGLPFTAGFLTKGLLFYNTLSMQEYFATSIFFFSAFMSFLYLIPVCYAIFKKVPQKQAENFVKIPLTFNVVFLLLIIINVLMFIFSGIFFMNYVNEW
jgi:multicomponent Na+:H+ antiporter subunit D